MTILLKNSTVSGVVPLPTDLVAGELALNSADGKAFMKLDSGTVKELGGGTPTPPITPWVRNPTWLPMPVRTAADEVVDILVAIYPESNYIALTCATALSFAFTVDWGDGSTPINGSSGLPLNYLYDYNNPTLNGTNGPITFTDSTDTVNRIAHGYTDGMKISFAEIVTTTGITQLQTYYVVNATTDTFQLSATSGGSVLPLTNNGTGAILPYKQAMVKVYLLSVGNTFSTVNLQVKNSTSGLSAYSQPILDCTISIGSATLTIGGTIVPMRLMERCTILRLNMNNLTNLFINCSSLQSVSLPSTFTPSNLTSMFSGCSSLQSAPFIDTSFTSNMNSMFLNCVSLQSVPLFNTQNVTSMTSMFSGCNSLLELPLFDTQNVTDMQSMFLGCRALQSVPSFNTPKLTNTSLMFQNCSFLQSVPLFDTALVTSMTTMFNGCSSLQSVPLFNTANVVNFGGSNTTNSVFGGCSALQTVPLFNTVKVTSFAFTFANCTNIGSIPAFDTSGVTGTTAFTQMFLSCSSLQQIPDMNFNRAAITTTASYTNMFNSCSSLSKINLSPGNGPKFTFSVANCKLSAAALNQLYTSLPTVTAQTITVTGNVGIAGDDPSIATAKGWTVSGS